MIITHVLVYYFPFENERPKSFTVKHSDAAFEAMYDCNSHSWQILRSNMRSLCWWLFIMLKGFNSIAYLHISERKKLLAVSTFENFTQ